MTAAKHSHLGGGGGPFSPFVTISLHKRCFHGGVVPIEFPPRMQMFYGVLPISDTFYWQLNGGDASRPCNTRLRNSSDCVSTVSTHTFPL